MNKPKSWIFPKLIDLHAHLREKEMLALMVKLFYLYSHVVCMGNLKRLVSDYLLAYNYRKQIIGHKPRFVPAMVMMLTKNTTMVDIVLAAKYETLIFKVISRGFKKGGSGT